MHLVRGVGVDGEGHPDIGVPQHLLSSRGVDAIGGERGGEAVRSPETTTTLGFARFISMIVRSRSSGTKRELPQWMSLIWHMVNRPLPMFCSVFGPGLDHPRSLSDGQSSGILEHRQKHYNGLVIRLFHLFSNILSSSGCLPGMSSVPDGHYYMVS